MADITQQLEQYLHKNGQHCTRPRQLVFDALRTHGPIALPELIQNLNLSVDKSSVYRTVALFERLNIVRRISMGWKYKLELSDSFQAHHHHFSCEVCGVHLPLNEDLALENYLSALAKANNFEMREHQIEIQGLCGDCRRT